MNQPPEPETTNHAPQIGPSGQQRPIYTFMFNSLNGDDG